MPHDLHHSGKISGSVARGYKENRVGVDNNLDA
jgi:hypothetical protein